MCVYTLVFVCVCWWISRRERRGVRVTRSYSYRTSMPTRGNSTSLRTGYHSRVLSLYTVRLPIDSYTHSHTLDLYMFNTTDIHTHGCLNMPVHPHTHVRLVPVWVSQDTVHTHTHRGCGFMWHTYPEIIDGGVSVVGCKLFYEGSVEVEAISC